MSQQRPAVLTPVSLDDFLVAAYAVWLHRLRGSPPPIPAVEIIAAHWAIETGWGKKCYCHNVGNRKTKPGGSIDWTFFPCGEELPLATAQRVSDADQRVSILREYVLGGRSMASVRIVPEHPWCCFGAFSSLTEGLADHLALLHRRFSDAFTAALDGDPRAYSISLKRAGYYTADVERYTTGLVGCLPRVEDTSRRINWSQCPQLTDWQIRSVEGVIALSAQLTDDDWEDMRRERDASLVDDDGPEAA